MKKYSPLPGGAAICALALLILAGFPATAGAQIASEPVFSLDFVNLYMELFPDKSEAFIIAHSYFTCNGSDTVVMRCEGNFKHMTIRGKTGKEGFFYQPPLFYFPKLASGDQELTFEYRVQHSGLATSGALIGLNKLKLGPEDYWYPRNVASDAHQVLLNVDSPPTYEIDSNGETIRDVPNNLKRLRTFVVRDALEEGMVLTGGR